MKATKPGKKGKKKMGTFKPSKFQQAIFDFIESGEGSAIVEAVAGSGKTTTIVKAMKLISRKMRVVFLAFNKAIAEELSRKVPPDFQVMTLNSLGHRAWMRFIDGRVTLNANKTRDILNSEHVMRTYDEWTVRRLQSPVRKLVGVAKSVGLVPDGVEDAEGLVPDTEATWNGLIEHFDIQFGSRNGSGARQYTDPIEDRRTAIQLAREVLNIGLRMWNEIDFDDQLYMSVVFGAPISKFDFVFVDEAQDVSDIQRSMLEMAKKKSGRLIAVGDPAQAIYGFRGADSMALENIAKTFNATHLPLSISYRCPKAVVAEAQKFVSHIQASDTAPEGTVKDLGDYQPGMFNAENEDMVVCRNMAPLIGMAYSLIGAKVPATVQGRDLAQGLITLIKKLNAKGLDRLMEKMDDWKAKECARLLKKDDEADLSKIEDKHEVIMTFINKSGAQSVPALITAIESLFGDKRYGMKKTVVLSTIHRAKGLEADTVFILDAHLMPCRYARKDWQIQQETNLQYVAVTRAKNTLAFISSPKKGDK